MAADIMKLDLYGYLGIESNAEEGEIRKAYRKKALVCHPDKNPDNPKAAEEFQKLSIIFEVLIDPQKRGDYDKVLKARQAHEVRNRQLDAKRRKLIEDLEAREKGAKSQAEEEFDTAIKLAREIERLRKEGSEQLQKENELMKKQIEEEIRLRREQEQINLPRLKVKWNRKQMTLDEDKLSNILSKYGELNCLVLSKKGNSAIVEFKLTHSAVKAVECSASENLIFEWLQGKPVFASVAKDSPKANSPASTSQHGMPSSTIDNLEDYESQVLQRMRQAQARKRAEEQIRESESQ